MLPKGGTFDLLNRSALEEMDKSVSKLEKLTQETMDD